MEIWKDMIDDTSYCVSNFGNVRHKKNMVNRKFRKDHKGYFRFNTSKGTYMVHQQVAKAFIKNENNKPFLNHIDANKTNNKVENLEWCTPKENVQHAYKIGTRGIGEKHTKAKLNEAQVKKIKYELSNKYEQKEIAKMFNVTPSCIFSIIRGRTWTHI